jgi:hypothetical protein
MLHEFLISLCLCAERCLLGQLWLAGLRFQSRAANGPWSKLMEKPRKTWQKIYGANKVTAVLGAACALSAAEPQCVTGTDELQRAC